MIKIIEEPEFKKLKSTGHAFFTRTGGVSKGHYHSLNCIYHGTDDPQNIEENRRRVMAHLNFPQKSFITVKNVHGNFVAVIDDLSLNYEELEADALVTKNENAVLALGSADCPIVLFSDEQAEIIGLAHAGWKGAQQGIIEATIDKMVSLGASLQNICAVISPCITQAYYEVSAEFYQNFISMKTSNKIYFIPSINAEHFMFDLLNYNKDKLLIYNLKLVTIVGIDTYSNEEIFFSRRRSYLKGELEFGCHLACIYFK